ncbi:MAG: DUF5688 family protein [Lachnospiraceae bacterium]|nr:DUF5688 family protein [Lachnospiraceae bacterium]
MNRQTYQISESLDLINRIASMQPAEKAAHLHVRLVDIMCMEEREDAILKDVGNNFALKLCFRLDREDGCLGMIPLTRTLARVLRFPLGGLADLALAATESAAPATFHSIQSFILDSQKGLFPGSPLLSEVAREDVNSFDIYILSSSLRTYGASALYYPGVTEKISWLLGGSYYVLPSSVHEVLIVPDPIPAAGLDGESLSEIVRLVNEQELEPSDLLSYRVLYYDSEKKMLCETAPAGVCENV